MEVRPAYFIISKCKWVLLIAKNPGITSFLGGYISSGAREKAIQVFVNIAD